MSVTGGTEWSEVPEAGIRIGAHSEEVLLMGKPAKQYLGENFYHYPAT
jgi:hypothetical protein